MKKKIHIGNEICYSNKSYTISAIYNGVVKIVDFKNKKVINMDLKQLSFNKYNNEKMYAGFNSGWKKGNEFENIY